MKRKMTGRKIMTLALAATLSACGGGGGDGGAQGGSGNGTGGGGTNTAVNYTVEITAVSLEDIRSGQDIVADGLPISGATVTRN